MGAVCCLHSRRRSPPALPARRCRLAWLAVLWALSGVACAAGTGGAGGDDTAVPATGDTAFGTSDAQAVADTDTGGVADEPDGSIDSAGGPGPVADGAGGTDPADSADVGPPGPADVAAPPGSDADVEPAESADSSSDKQPLAGVCASGADCLTGDCNSALSGGYCTVWCATSADCPDGAHCYVDAASGLKMCWKDCSAPGECRQDQVCAGVCTPRCEPGDCDAGYACDPVGGQCEPASPIPCDPTPELCGDGVDQSCDGITDEGCGPAVADSPTVERVDLGMVGVGGGVLSQTLEVVADAAVDSLTILVLDADGSDEVMAVWELTDPSGELLVDATDPLGAPIRALPTIGALTVQVPNTPTVAVTPGKYRFTVFREGPAGHVWVHVLLNRRSDEALASEQSALDVNYWFVGLPNLDAAKAQTNVKFQSLLTLFEGVLGAHGITIGQTAYLDVTGAAAQQYTVVDVTNEPYTVDEHAELLSLSAGLPESNRGVNFFFVQGFTGSGVIGRAGGIPGPPLFQGGYQSGVVVSLIDYYGWPGEYGLSSTAAAMAHELGHQLGLFHTTEQGGQVHDPIPDTPECTDDWNGDGLVSVDECKSKDGDNLMFWSTNLSGDLSSGQKYVIHRNASLY